MNRCAVAVFTACVALSYAQLLPTNAPSAAASTPSSGTNPNQGLLESLLAGTMGGGQSSAGASVLPPAPTGTGISGGAIPGGNNVLQQMFTNPMLSLGLTGFDNVHRAFLSPYIARMGNNNLAFHYLRGGMDKIPSVMMSDYFGRMLSQSTGMNPMLTSVLTGQMFDAPDSYALTNMLFNGMSGGSTQQNPLGSAGLPNGAATAPGGNGQSGNPFSSSLPLLLMPMMF